jgi:hypothetical protein
MRFGTYLTGKGLVTPEQVMEALDLQQKNRVPIGKLAQETGKLSGSQVLEILNAQVENGQPFGQIAVEFGYLSALELADLLTAQKERNKPIGEILVEMGAIDAEVLETQYAHYRRVIDEALDLLIPLPAES